MKLKRLTKTREGRVILDLSDFSFNEALLFSTIVQNLSDLPIQRRNLFYLYILCRSLGSDRED